MSSELAVLDPKARLPARLRASTQPGELLAVVGVAAVMGAGVTKLGAVLGLSGVTTAAMVVLLGPSIALSAMARAVRAAAKIQVEVGAACAQRRFDRASALLRGAPRATAWFAQSRLQMLIATAIYESHLGRWSSALRLYDEMSRSRFFRAWRKSFSPAWVGWTRAHAMAAVFAGDVDRAEALMVELDAVPGAGEHRNNPGLEIFIAVRRGEIDRALALFERDRRRIELTVSRVGFLEIAFVLAYALDASGRAYRSDAPLDRAAVVDAARRGDLDYLTMEWPELAEYLGFLQASLRSAHELPPRES